MGDAARLPQDRREYSSKPATAQLAHSGTAITEEHYIEKASESPDLTDVLEKFGLAGVPDGRLEQRPS